MLKKVLFMAVLVTFVFSAFTVLPAYAAGDNLVKNGDFESTTGSMPTSWNAEAFKMENSEYKIDSAVFKNGKNSVSIFNKQPNDAKLAQDIVIEPEKVYKVSCWIKTENIKNPPGSPNITLENAVGIYTSREINDTRGNWENLEFYIRPQKEIGNSLKVSVRLGGQGTTNEGKAYFDDLSVVKVEDPPKDAKIESFYIPSQYNANQSNDTTKKDSSGGIPKPLLFVLAGVVVVGLLIFIEVKFSKRGKAPIEDGTADDSDEEDIDSDDSEEDDEEEENKR